jgi:hypothetical protein
VHDVDDAVNARIDSLEAIGAAMASEGITRRSFGFFPLIKRAIEQVFHIRHMPSSTP